MWPVMRSGGPEGTAGSGREPVPCLMSLISNGTFSRDGENLRFARDLRGRERPRVSPFGYEAFEIFGLKAQRSTKAHGW
jgi:hypothetical protein